jgi:hypothetical protein
MSMTRSQALTEARKRLGLHARVQDRRTPSSPTTRAAAKAHHENFSQQVYYRYRIGAPIGDWFIWQGTGDTWEDALASLRGKPPKPPDVQLPEPTQPAALPQETRSRSTRSIPTAKPVTEQRSDQKPARKRCADCGAAITKRTRCNRCALQHWRAQHPEQKREQDRRYREGHPKRVRELVRARVANWRKRNRTATSKKVGV